jgi:hypothetical protein
MDKARAQSILARIDEILRWDQRVDQQRDQKFAELGKHLCEVRDQRYWRLGYKSFEEFLEVKFPDSRRKAYYLMSIHDNLRQIPTEEIEVLGWSKALELAKVARNQGRSFSSATWLHRAKECTKQELKEEVYLRNVAALITGGHDASRLEHLLGYPPMARCRRCGRRFPYPTIEDEVHRKSVTATIRKREHRLSLMPIPAILEDQK